MAGGEPVVTYYCLKPMKVGDEWRATGELIPEAGYWKSNALRFHVREADIAPVLLATLPKASRDAVVDFHSKKDAEMEAGEGTSSSNDNGGSTVDEEQVISSDQQINTPGAQPSTEQEEVNFDPDSTVSDMDADPGQNKVTAEELKAQEAKEADKGSSSRK